MDELVQRIRCFNGHQHIFKHQSPTLNCEMTLGIYVPDHEKSEKLPTLLFCTGMTFTPFTTIEKSGCQRLASKYRVIFITPDTSPRVDLPGDEDDWQFGKGCGFYLDATIAPWSEHYKMYSYMSREIPELASALFSAIDMDRLGILGHSMGGHGALVIGLRNPIFKTISALAPISNPSHPDCVFGMKAFRGYLGADKEMWKGYDSAELLTGYQGTKRTILVDQGTGVEYLAPVDQLRPTSLTLPSNPSVTVQLRWHEGYDHSYFFIATFLEDHFRFHLGL